MNFKISIYLLLLLIGSCFSADLSAQENYQVRTYTQDNGLAHNFVQSIAQDQSGFIWIATWDGLSRYDGSEFRNYYHRPDDTTSITFFVADKVVVDQINNVWVLCQGRQSVTYDRAKDCFKRFYFNSDMNSKVNDIAVGHDSIIWLTMRTHLYKYNVLSKKIEDFKIVSDNEYRSICDNNSGQIVIDNKDGIWLYYWVNNEYYIFSGTFSGESELLLHSVGKINLNRFESAALHNNTGDFDIHVSESGKTWLFSKYGLFYLDSSSHSFLENSDVLIPSEFNGKKYFTWTEDKTGIHIINTIDHTHVNIRPDDKNFIETVFIDNMGIVWSGDINPTRDNIGLKKYLKIPSYFRHFLTGKNENNIPNLVFPIVKDIYGDIIVGTRYLDYLFFIKPDGTQEKFSFSDRLNISGKPVPRAMVEDSAGIWICTTTGQIIYLDIPTKKSFLKFPARQNDTLMNLYIHNILRTSDKLIANASKGIYGFIPSSDTLLFYYKQKNEGTSHTLVKDGKNGFWLGTEGNLIMHFDPEFIKIAQFKLGPENNIVEHICVGDSNDIWVALMGGGVGHLYPESGKMELFTSADGLSNNVTYSILKDSGGNLWISTNNGISRFNPRTRLFRNFGKTEGLLISEFNSDSYYQSADGEMFFGGVGGLVGFYPDSINNYRFDNASNPLLITDFRVSGISRNFRKAVYELDTLTLQKGDNNFQITYACLNYQNAEKIKYRYRLLGENNNWIETDFRNRKINYANLAHKDYLLEIESTNERGEWLNKLSVLIRIPDRFLEMTWVRLILVILCITAISFLFLYYVKNLKLKARQVQDQLRMESLRGQMNPHFIFNSLNSINYFISKEDKVSANHYIADFSRLIRSILNNLSSDYIPFQSEIESINDYMKLEYLRFSDKFDYEISIENISDGMKYSVFPGLVQPFIENAIWHGVRGLEHRKGFIKITFIMVSETKIQCLIEDDGIGRKLANKFKNDVAGHKSRGVGIVLERIRIINNISKTKYQVLIEDLYSGREDTGTRVTLDLPVKKTILDED
jgi:streptogramin lyase